MKHMEIRAALEPYARARMTALEPKTALGNGTRLADAAATILTAVLARQGVKAFRKPEETVAAVTEVELREVFDTVRDLVNDGDSDRKVTLSGGVTLEAGYRSGIVVGTIGYVPVRGMPGLHDSSAWGSAPGDPGDEKLRREVAKAMARLPAMDVPVVGMTDVAVRHDYRWRDVLVVPMRGGPGVTYMDETRIHPVETLLDIEIALIAQTVAAKARDMWKQSPQIDVEYQRVLAEIGPVLDAAKADGLPVRLAGVKVSRAYGRIDVDPLVEVLGNDLKPAIWTPDTSQGTSLEKATRSQMVIQRRRKRIMDEAAVEGARGRIDRVTLAAIRAHAADPAEVLRRMAKSRRVTVRNGRPEGTHAGGRPLDKHNPLRITWRNGRIESSFEFAEGIAWQHGTLVLKKAQFPQTVLDMLPGKPISALIDHPFLTPDDRIRSVRVQDREDGYKYFNVDASWTTFDAETGMAAD